MIQYRRREVATGWCTGWPVLRYARRTSIAMGTERVEDAEIVRGVKQKLEPSRIQKSNGESVETACDA